MPQSLPTYAVAVCVVATISRATRAIFHVEGSSMTVPLAVSFLIGIAMLAIVVSDAQTRPRGLLDWLLTACVATVNSLVVFAAAIGIDKL